MVLVTAFLKRPNQPTLYQIEERELERMARLGFQPVSNLTREQLLGLLEGLFAEFEQVRSVMQTIHDEAANWAKCE